MKTMLTAWTAIVGLLWASAIHAQEAKVIKNYQDYGDYRVSYSVFNSDLVSPEIARQYNLVRARDRAFVNISVNKKGALKGVSTKLSGRATNLIQQSRPLKFREIKDQDAVYYLAPLRFENEESLTFNIELVLPDGSKQQLTFRRQLYKN